MDDEAEFDDDLTVLPAAAVAACAAAFAEVSAEAIAEEESTLAQAFAICQRSGITGGSIASGGWVYEAL